MYSQNKEEEVILKYFGENKGVLLDLGANDGITLSNSYQLICNGWEGYLVDASEEALSRAVRMHFGKKVMFFNFGLADKDGELSFHTSGSHLNKGDVSLISTFKKEETERWKGVEFKEKKVLCFSWVSFYNSFLIGKKFDFITIDIEGYDWEVLSKMDLKEMDTSLVCVEYNGKEAQKYIDYCKQFGMKLIHRNGENLILGK